MFKLDKFFSKGLKDSVLLTGSMSHNGPWKQAYADTLIDRFHVSDFSSAEYTISADYDKDKKELTCNDPLGCYPYFINQSGDSIKYSLEMLKEYVDWGLCKGENESIDHLDKGYTIGDLSRSIRFALIRHPYARRQLEKKGLLDQYNKVKSFLIKFGSLSYITISKSKYKFSPSLNLSYI